MGTPFPYYSYKTRTIKTLIHIKSELIYTRKSKITTRFTGSEGSLFCML